MLQQSKKSPRGIVVVLVALGLVGLIGVVALTVDGGMLQVDYRKARAHADASAMAAACCLYRDYPTNQGKDVGGLAAQEAIDTAAKNGCTNDGVTSKVTVNIPPSTGPYEGLSGYAEVNVTYYVSRAFSRVFGTAAIPVTARAVARGASIAPKVGVLILDYDDKASLTGQGNGAFTETGAPVIVNSNDAAATVTTGAGMIKGHEFYITGGLTIDGTSSLISSPTPDQVFTGTHPTPDPLGYLPPPSKPADGTITGLSIATGTVYTLTPGRYTNLPNFATGDVVILEQASTNGAGGIIYLDGGGFHSNGASILLGSGSGGVLLYNRPASTGDVDKVQIIGDKDGSVIFSGLTNGPYSGLTLWQDRNSKLDLQLEGNGNFSIQGTVYASGARLNAVGNAKTALGDITGFFLDETSTKVDGTSRIGSQYIVNNLSLSGNGNIRLDYVPQKLARTRVITLVE